MCRSLFCDFGKDFVVVDKNGEQPTSCLVQHISRDTEGVVLCNEDTRHDLETGDFVTFSEVAGMSALNEFKPQEVTVLTPYSFSIGDTLQLPEYTGGGIVTEFKAPVTLQFVSLGVTTLPHYLISCCSVRKV